MRLESMSRDFQLEGLAQAQAAGVNRGQGHPMVQGGDPGENGAHFAGREDDGQFELGRSAGKLQLGGPGALEGFLPEEFDRAQSLSGSLAGKAPLGLEVDEILTELFGADLIGGAVKVFGQVAHAGPVTLLAAGLERQQGQIFGEAVQDCVGGTFFICIDLQVIVDGLPCVSAWRAVSSLRKSRLKTNAKPNLQRPMCEAAAAPSSPPRSGFVQQALLGNWVGGRVEGCDLGFDPPPSPTP